MVGEFFAGLGAFKTMMDMTKAVQDAHDVATRDRAVIELQKEILSAQMAQAGLIERIGQLEKEVASFEKWDTEKDKYELQQIYAHTYAYASKPIADSSEPPHLICANCYDRRKKSLLQRADSAHLHCPECKTRLRFDEPERPIVRHRSHYRPYGGD